MDDSDDDLLHERAAASFAQGIIFTDDDLLQLIHDHSLDELALIVPVFQNEAFAFLRDPVRAQERAFQLIAAVARHLSENDHTVFATFLEGVQGCVEQDQEILNNVPMFEYVPRGDGVAIKVTFPDEDTA
jgi:hypothetical protein